MLRVHRSHRSDDLVVRLATELARPHPDPFVAEIVAVQSRGMERWLSHQLAQVLGATHLRDGICANVRFPFPGSVVHQVLEATVGQRDGDADPWDPDRLVWSILEVLPDLLGHPDAHQLRSYLGEADGAVRRRRYTLARELADLFDRYAMYRPRMVGRWSAGELVGPEGAPLAETHRWQAALWRRLVSELNEESPDRRYASAIEALRDPGREIGSLPHRLAFFGTSALPSTYVRVLAALAQRIPVEIYLTSPSPSLWRRVHEAAAELDTTSVTAVVDAVAPTQRNPLLVSSGRLARDSQATLEVGAPGYLDEPLGASEDGASDLLGLVASDVLADRDRGAPVGVGAGVGAGGGVGANRAADDGERTPSAAPLADGDRSIQLHACHGPARQVEVLHDVLLAAFDELEGLEPRDILVMAPDIETFAPHVAAVFGSSEDDHRGTPAIPYELADRSLQRTNPVAEVLLAVVGLPQSRVEASRVLDLLSLGPVRRRFDLTEGDLARLRSWIAETGIRWALDASHRERHDQPGDRYHTWRFGLDRLLLGVAMAEEDDRIVGDVAPFDDMEGDSVDLLNRFASFYEVLHSACEELCQPRTITDWTEALSGLLDGFVEVETDEAWLVQQVRRSVQSLVEASGATAVSQLEIDLEALREMLDRALSAVPRRAGFETGAVTFASMIPMRSIPHRVICLLGMDDGAFPRAARPLGFDLIAAAPQVGDRTPRDEDRYLFLEAVLAARDRLVITYTGRDTKTNEERPPAVPVGELLDVIDRSVEVTDGQPRDAITTVHPLQAFSPRNFGVDARGRRCEPLSHDTRHLEAANAYRGGTVQPVDAFPEALPAEEGEDEGLVEYAALVDFYGDPVKWLLKRRVGLSFSERHISVQDVEPLDVDNLVKWRLGDQMLRAVRVGRDMEAWRGTRLAHGDIPVGAPGHHEIDALDAPVRGIIDLIEEPLSQPSRDVPVDLAVSGRRLVGLMRDVHGDDVVRWQFSRLKPKTRLQLWIAHLVLNLAEPDAEHVSLHAGRGKSGDDVEAISFAPLGGDPDERRVLAEARLVELIDLHIEGRRRPLPLFPDSSLAYASCIHEGATEDVALATARKKWVPGRNPWDGDVNQPHIAQIFGELDFETVVATTAFTDVARTVWLPVLSAEPVA